MRRHSIQINTVLLTVFTLAIVSCSQVTYQTVGNDRFALSSSDPVVLIPTANTSYSAQEAELHLKNQLYAKGFNLVNSTGEAKYIMETAFIENTTTITTEHTDDSTSIAAVPLTSNNMTNYIPTLGLAESTSTTNTVTKQVLISRSIIIKVYTADSRELVWSSSATSNLYEPSRYYSSIISSLLDLYGQTYYGQDSIESSQ